MDQIASLTRPRAGRPTKEQAEARHAELLDAALDHFLDRGFEQATIEAIATSVNMTKRTVYARYSDKASLFLAAVHRAIDRVIVPKGSLERLEKDDLESTLIAVARLRLKQMMTPEGIKLQRIINTESYRFPEIFMQAYERGAGPIVAFVARQLRRHAVPGSVAHSDPEMAGAAFMSQVIGGPVRYAVSGNFLSERQIERRLAFTVKLFIEGVKTA